VEKEKRGEGNKSLHEGVGKDSGREDFFRPREVGGKKKNKVEGRRDD